MHIHDNPISRRRPTSSVYNITRRRERDPVVPDALLTVQFLELGVALEFILDTRQIRQLDELSLREGGQVLQGGAVDVGLAQFLRRGGDAEPTLDRLFLPGRRVAHEVFASRGWSESSGVPSFDERIGGQFQRLQFIAAGYLDDLFGIGQRSALGAERHQLDFGVLARLGT